MIGTSQGETEIPPGLADGLSRRRAGKSSEPSVSGRIEPNVRNAGWAGSV
jgi:hypothetical protein